MEECVFCNIVAKNVPAEVVYADDKVTVIKDILPKAPVHLLVLSNEHIASVVELKAEHEALAGHMLMAAKQVAERQGIGKDGYKLIFNVCKHGGQIVPHIHLHILGGKQLSE